MNPHLRSLVTLPTHAWFLSLVSTTLLVCLLASATNVKAQQQGWSATGSLDTVRYGHTATLLANGKVLVVGGISATDEIGSAELYHPATGQWSATGSLSTPRAGHIAVRLANGKVLVAGGGADPFITKPTTSAEIYDPDTGAWSAAGSLSGVRLGARATLLADGRVLVIGGFGVAGGRYFSLNSAELYDPATGAWSPGGMMNLAYCHTATLLPNGKVLVVGGYGNAELYDPATGSWTATSDLINPRVLLTATLLPNGKVLVAGGARSDHCDGLYAPAELYDPATEQWSATGSMTAPRAGHTATLLPNGKVLVAGGDDVCNVLNSAELYDPGTGSWSVTGSLNTARGAHTATLLANGKVLVVGGYVTPGSSPTSAELFDSGTTTVASVAVLTLNSTKYCVGDSWNLKVTNAAPTAAIRLIGTSNGTSWEIPRWANTDANGNFSTTGIFATDAVGSHTVQVEITGSTSDILPLEVVNCEWRKTTSLNTARPGHLATLLANGKVLVTGGPLSSGAADSTELYNPATETWSVTGKLNTARGGYTATLLPNGKILVAGGYGGSPVRALNSAELYDPETETWSVTGNLNSVRSDHTATLLPNGKVLVARGGFDSLYTAELYDPGTGTWRMTGSLPSGAYYQTATLLPNGKVLLAGGSGSDHHSYPLSGAVLYDPATETWTATGNLNIPRLGQTATLLPNGKVLVAGGTESTSPGVKLGAELYDPATETWSLTGILNTPFEDHTATLLPNGKVLLVGASVNWSSRTMTNKADLYDPDTGIWSDAATPNITCYDHTATLLPSGKVLVVGGAGMDPWLAPLKSAELYDGGFETPLLTLNSTSYCVGAPWVLTVTRAARAASVRLMGVSNGASWEIARWGAIDADGSFRASGTMANGTGGTHTLRVEINGVWSNALSFTVSNCKPLN